MNSSIVTTTTTTAGSKHTKNHEIEKTQSNAVQALGLAECFLDFEGLRVEIPSLKQFLQPLSISTRSIVTNKNFSLPLVQLF